MNNIISLNILQFSLIYLLLILVLFIMKKAKISQTRLLIWASFRMSIQLVLAGLILTYLFKNPHPLFTMLYLLIMILFSIYMVIQRNKDLNTNFKITIALSLALTGLLVVIYFIVVVINTNFFNPQYTIPISGMIFGSSVTGLTIALKTFKEALKTNQLQISVLLNIGTKPKDILRPFIIQSVETALLPTLNSMLGMGIISLPGMMSGQILSGTLPIQAILYQIAIIVAITTVTCASVFFGLYFGQFTIYNKYNRFN